MNLIVGFLKSFGCKYLGTVALEKITITLLKELVTRTGSKIDDKIYEAVFEKINKG